MNVFEGMGTEMLDTTNTIVQALVWTTAAGLLYAIWLRTETTSKYKIDLSIYWQQVVEVLSWMWVLLAIGLVISMLICAGPGRTASASQPATTECAPYNYNCSSSGTDQGTH